MIQEDDLIRRLVAQGHQVGLILTGSDLATCQQEFELGKQLLYDIARSPLLAISADNLSEAGQTTLQESGFALWKATHHMGDLTTANLLRKLDTDTPNYIQVTCDADGLGSLRNLLPVLTSEKCDLRRALPPML